MSASTASTLFLIPRFRGVGCRSVLLIRSMMMLPLRVSLYHPLAVLCSHQRLGHGGRGGIGHAARLRSNIPSNAVLVLPARQLMVVLCSAQPPILQHIRRPTRSTSACLQLRSRQRTTRVHRLRGGLKASAHPPISSKSTVIVWLLISRAVASLAVVPVWMPVACT